MNRIYQGHVTKVEIPDAKDGDGKPRWKEMPKWQDALWEHHKLFQDAVNYYIVALAALADPKHATSRLIKDLRARVSAAWSEFPRPVGDDARSLRRSIAHWLRLSDKASLEDAFETVLNGTRQRHRCALWHWLYFWTAAAVSPQFNKAGADICLAFVTQKPNRFMTLVLFPKQRESERTAFLRFSMEKPAKMNSRKSPM